VWPETGRANVTGAVALRQRRTDAQCAGARYFVNPGSQSEIAGM
jgi:hypothetical protein